MKFIDEWRSKRHSALKCRIEVLKSQAGLARISRSPMADINKIDNQVRKLQKKLWRKGWW